jgi:hypothetical protein
MENLIHRHVLRVSGWRRLFRLVMFSAVGLCAQSGEWAQVQALVPGAQVEVRRFSGGGEVRGTVERVSGDALVVQRKQDSVTVARADVRRVRLRSEERSKNGRIAGAVILGGLALISAGISDGASAGGTAATVGIFGGLGYLIGWAFDGPKRIVIYKAQKP